MSRNYTRLIGSTATADLSALGSNQQRDLDYIQTLISDKEILNYFSDPVINENNEKIDWYTNAKGQIVLFKDLSELEQGTVKNELDQLTTKLKIYSDKVENDFDKLTFDNLCRIPDTNSIVKVGNQVVITNWAYQLRKSRELGTNLENFAGLASASSTIELERDAIQAPKNINYVPDVEQPNLSSEIEEVVEDRIRKNSPPKSDPPEQLDTESEIDHDIDQKETDTSSDWPKTKKWFGSYWTWILVFCILLFLNLALVSDACGIRGIAFLNFCTF